MKTNKTRTKKLLVALFAMLMPLLASAHDFYRSGIYFNITSTEDLTVEVTYQGNNSYSYRDEYLGNVIIPSKVTYNNIEYCVTAIKEGTFQECRSLTSITIPESIKNIGKDAFQYCSNLMSVYITSLQAWCCINFEGQNANPFWYAKDLYLNGDLVKELVIPNTVTKVSDYAFYQCNSITSVTISEGVKTIGNHTFAGCNSLKKVEMNNSVEIIGDYAFMGCNWLNSVNISESCTYIGASAFFDCRLYDITIPKNVTFIGGNAFEPYGNSDIAIHISDIEAWCKIEFGGYYTEQKRLNLYLNGESISELEIPNTINKIKDYAFYFCANLTSVTIPDNVTSIGKFAFYNCSNLTSVQLSNNLDSIGDYAFQSTALHHIDIPQSITYIGYGAFESCRNITSITIPEGTTYIGNDAFRGCQFTSLKLPKSLSFLGGDAFYGTKWFNNQNDGVVYCDNWVVGYKGSMPENCTIEIAEGTLGIASYAFRNQSNLVSVVLPKTINKILSSTFEYCFNLKKIDLPSALTYIGSNAFSSTALENIFIPEGVVEIDSRAFMYCEKIRTINIPRSVEQIGDYAFWCYKYADINVCSNPSITSYSFPEGAMTHLILTDQNASDFNINNINTYNDVVYHRELASGKYGTIMLPFSPDAESLENFVFYSLTSAENDVLIFDEVEAPQANTPYLFSLREGKSATQITGRKTTISSVITNPEEVNGWQMLGSFTNQTIATSEDADNYYYAYTSADNQLHKVTKTLNVKPYRAYFVTDTANPAQLAVRTRNGETTLIDAAEVEDFSTGTYYDLSGRRVENPTKGLYIVNGKKVIL